MFYYVYFARSIKTKKVYLGSTSKSPKERVAEHNLGCNIWTKNNRPFELIYFEKYHCKTDAIKREEFYKSGFGRKIKQAIISVIN